MLRGPSRPNAIARPIGDAPVLLRRDFIAGLATALAVAGCHRQHDAAAEDAIGPLLPAATLAGRIDDVKAGKVAVLYVGPDVLFGRGHIPGATKLAPVESDEGRRALNDALARIPAATEIVVYCGCCPVRSCPNVRPASAAIRASKRANARVLDLPTRFATDWTDKGYPVERG